MTRARSKILEESSPEDKKEFKQDVTDNLKAAKATLRELKKDRTAKKNAVKHAEKEQRAIERMIEKQEKEVTKLEDEKASLPNVRGGKKAKS